mgnify:CR=1 FL=1
MRAAKSNQIAVGSRRFEDCNLVVGGNAQPTRVRVLEPHPSGI